MKTQLLVLLILIVTQTLCYKTPEAVNKQLAWKAVCRIKAKGTFKLSHVKNKDAEWGKLEQEKQNLTADLERAAGDAEQTETLQQQLDVLNEQMDTKKAADVEEHDELNAEILDLEGQIEPLQLTLDDEEGDPVAKQEAAVAISPLKQKLDKAQEKLLAHQNGRQNKVNLFLEDEQNSIELPYICKSRLSSPEILELGVKGKDFRDRWIAAFGPPAARRRNKKNKKVGKTSKAMRFSKTQQDEEEAPQPTYNNMPPLNKEQFNTFYASIIGSDNKEEGALYLELGEDDPEGEDSKQEIFSTALFGKARTLINWLEFWVYMCADGVEPNESEYLGDDADDTCAEMDPLFVALPEDPARRNSARHHKKQSTLNRRRKN